MVKKSLAQKVLDLELEDNDSGETTVRGYLKALLFSLWSNGEGFSGKRPFGNSGWAHDLYIPLVVNGLVAGELDENGYIMSFDTSKANKLIFDAIEAL